MNNGKDLNRIIVGSTLFSKLLKNNIFQKGYLFIKIESVDTMYKSKYLHQICIVGFN